MAKAIEHYENLLADHYSWLWGGLEAKITENESFFKESNIVPKKSGNAVDLGSGSGFQTIPLSKAGFNVTAIDLSTKLLEEIAENSPGLKIQTCQDDMLNFQKHVPEKIELAVCMGDSLPHLNSIQEVSTLFTRVSNHLEVGGKFILTFRDLNTELKDLDRFIPVQSDSRKIFTCFLEYESEYVKVHDLIHVKKNGKWSFQKSFYRKLKISGDWAISKLRDLGLTIETFECSRGLYTIIASKQKSI